VSIVKPTLIVGIVLIIAGVIALASGRTADTDRERLLRASGESRRSISVPVGAVCILAGAGLVILGSKKGS
jgi:hypothetical protein